MQISVYCRFIIANLSYKVMGIGVNIIISTSGQHDLIAAMK